MFTAIWNRIDGRSLRWPYAIGLCYGQRPKSETQAARAVFLDMSVMKGAALELAMLTDPRRAFLSAIQGSGRIRLPTGSYPGVAIRCVRRPRTRRRRRIGCGGVMIASGQRRGDPQGLGPGQPEDGANAVTKAVLCVLSRVVRCRTRGQLGPADEPRPGQLRTPPPVDPSYTVGRVWTKGSDDATLMIGDTPCWPIRRSGADVFFARLRGGGCAESPMGDDGIDADPAGTSLGACMTPKRL